LAAGQGGGGGEKTMEIKIDSINKKDADQKLLSKTNQIPNYSHLQVIVFGEELSKEGIREHLDFFLREPEMRHLTKVVMSRGDAEKVFKIKPKNVDSTSQYIGEMLDQTHRLSLSVPQYIDLGTLQRKLAHPSDLLLSKVSESDDMLSVEGGAVVKEDTLQGWIDSKQALGYKWLEDDVTWGVIDMNIGEEERDRVSFQIIGSQTKVRPMMKPDEKKFVFNAELKIEGDVVEVGQDMFKAYDVKFVDKVEKQAEKEVEKLCEEVFEKLNKSYKVDALGLSEVVANHYPAFWDKHKNEWREYFSRSELKIKVDVSVRRIGLIK
jgi:Ger(x)C family germination protein